MSSKPIYPYTYLLKFKPTNQFYYGVKYGREADPKMFWVKYFTSSNIVKNLIKTFGKDAFEFEIRKIFKSPQAALTHEQTVIRRLSLISDTRFLNKAANNSTIAVSGYIYITNEIENLVWDKNIEVPDGYRKGTKFVDCARGTDTFWVNNNIYDLKLKKNDEIPQGFTLGRCESATKGKISYYDPTTKIVKFFNTDEIIPDGMIRGNPYHVNKNTIWMYHPQHNIEKKVYDLDVDSINELTNIGFIFGRLDSSTKNFNAAGAAAKGMLGKIWVNDGVKTIVTTPDAIPEGYVEGSLYSNAGFIPESWTCPHCGKTGSGEGNKVRWHFDNCKEINNIRIKKVAYHDKITKKRVYLLPTDIPSSSLVKGYYQTSSSSVLNAA